MKDILFSFQTFYWRLCAERHTAEGQQPWLRLKMASGFTLACIVMPTLYKTCFPFGENRKWKNSEKWFPLHSLLQKKKNHPVVCAQRLLVGWSNAVVCHLTWASLGDGSYLFSHSSELNCISRKTWANTVYSRVTRAALKRLNNFLLQWAHCWMKCGNKAWRST